MAGAEQEDVLRIPNQPQPATTGQPDDQGVMHLGDAIRKPVGFRDT